MIQKIAFTLGILIASVTWAGVHGGVDGGGGGTLPAHPIQVEDVVRTVQSSKQELRLLYRNLQKQADPQDPLDQKLFLHSPNLLDVLETAKVEVRLDKPCWDRFQNEVDASIYASAPNTICISAQRIAPKLSEAQRRTEILGLITHELTHLLGTDEKEAQIIQEWAASVLSASGPQEASDLIHRFSSGVSSFKFDEMKPWEESQVVLIVEKLQQDLSAPTGNSEFSIFDPTSDDLYEFMQARLTLAYWFALGQSSRPDAQKWKDQYEAVFGGKDSIRFDEAGAPIFWKGNSVGYLPLNRIHSLQGVRQQFSDMGVYLTSVQSYLDTLIFNNALFPLPDPHQFPSFLTPTTHERVWVGHIGAYKVKGVSCHSNGTEESDFKSIQEFTIQESTLLSPYITDGYYSLFEKRADGVKEKALFDFRDADVDGPVYVSGNGSEVQRVAEHGTPWSTSWVKDVYSMKETNGGYQLNRSYSRQTWDVKSVPVLQTIECQYDLEKVSP